MTGAELGADVIFGALLTLAVSLLKSVSWRRELKIALAAVLSLVLAMIISLAASNFDLSVLANWGVVFMTASTVYSTLLEKSGWETKLRISGVK